MSVLERSDNKIAGFVFKGQLAEASLEKLKASGTKGHELMSSDIAIKVSIKDLDPDAVTDAEKMSAVYIAIASFENMVRELISKRLLEQKGANWWEARVSEDIKKRADVRMKEEEKIRWHNSRGLSPIYFTELKDLVSILQSNWGDFKDLLPDIEWARHITKTIERSRNVIMHSGQLSLEDIDRVGMNIRDWIHQVGV